MKDLLKSRLYQTFGRKVKRVQVFSNCLFVQFESGSPKFVSFNFWRVKFNSRNGVMGCCFTILNDQILRLGKCGMTAKIHPEGVVSLHSGPRTDTKSKGHWFNLDDFLTWVEQNLDDPMLLTLV